MPAVRRDRKKKPAAERLPPPPPPPYRFQGQRLAFLESHVASFLETSLGDRENLCMWWRSVCAAYWKIFPWRLAVDVEPHPLMDMNAPQTGREAEEKVTTMLYTEAVSLFLPFFSELLLTISFHLAHQRVLLPPPLDDPTRAGDGLKT
jgi:hypothetical protein